MFFEKARKIREGFEISARDASLLAAELQRAADKTVDHDCHIVQVFDFGIKGRKPILEFFVRAGATEKKKAAGKARKKAAPMVFKGGA